MDRPHLFTERLSAHNQVLDAVIEALHLKNDAELSRASGIATPVISNIRHGTRPLGFANLLRILEVTNLTVRELHALAMKQPAGIPLPVDGIKVRSVRGKLRPRTPASTVEDA